jgi:hypothetical protein
MRDNVITISSRGHGRRRLAALAAALLLSMHAQAAEVGGIKLDDVTKVAGKDLRLNGAGVRTRLMFKVYAMGLYLGKGETTVDAVLAAPGPRRITLVMLREVGADDFSQAFSSGIESNTDKPERTRLAPQLAALGDIFKKVGTLKKGDTLTIDWVPDKGTLIELNGKPQSDALPEQGFYNALLRIWLGDKPADSSLKPQLLGG